MNTKYINMRLALILNKFKKTSLIQEKSLKELSKLTKSLKKGNN